MCHYAQDRIIDNRMAEEGKLRMRFYPMVYCDLPDRFCGDDFEKVDGGFHLSLSPKGQADGR